MPGADLKKVYIDHLNTKIQTLRSCLLLTPQVRESIAKDLELLAYISEHYPRQWVSGIKAELKKDKA